MQRQWAEFVARRNDDVLDDLTLDEFLFGAERVSLDRVRAPLLRLQGGRCFYCGDELRGRTDVDHFLPWSRSNDNGLDNLVAAHARCNNAKRASLAAGPHLQRWIARSRTQGDQLAGVAQDTSWSRQPERTHAIARALYLYQAPGTALWVAPEQYTEADATALRRLLTTQAPLGLAAEATPPYRP